MDDKPKPILTYAGDVGLFTSLASSIVQALPQDSTEWRRSYGRVTKSVKVEASFVPFSSEILPRTGDWQLIKQPIFHIYWTECLDVDVYKTTVRDDIESWLKTLTQHNIQDWLIVLVETYDIRKSNKLLPRTTVIDKIRSDFASKQGDRCISVINPVRSESRSAESWRGLLSRIRLLTLTAYNQTLLRFEEAIRDQRERRNEQGWCFCQYFLLQEEMAFVLEMLGVYDEALVQYDELDALFTQFVLNSNAGETASWLSSFQCPVEKWSGLTLSKTLSHEQRALIRDCKASLLEFRCYLFTRQCAMLLLTLKPWEIAQRSLPFLHNCCKELAILEISCPVGSLACWVFLCCLEVLYTCQRFSESQQVEAYSLYTASLWAYARDKLRELGELCGLMPGGRPTSEQLHLVVGLSAGMGDPPAGGGADQRQVSTPNKLREALSSQAAFQRQYLELSELAMGTYKHIGRIRSARLIGCDLASFYLSVGGTHTAAGDPRRAAAETIKAAAYLGDALRMYEEDSWLPLAAETRLQLAGCYRLVADWERFVKTSAVIASSPELPLTLRNSYFQEMMSALEKVNSDLPLLTSLDECAELVSVTVEPEQATEHSVVTICVVLESRFAQDVPRCAANVLLERVREAVGAVGAAEGRRRSSAPMHNSMAERMDRRLSAMGGPQPPSRQLSMVEHLDFREDKSLSSASVVARNPREFLRRTDSSSKQRRRGGGGAARHGHSDACGLADVTLRPGRNQFVLQYKAEDPGTYRVCQLSLLVAGRLDCLSPLIEPWLGFSVAAQASCAALNKGDGDLLTGLVQDMALTVKTGSAALEQDSTLTLQCSRGLTMRVKSSHEPLSRELSVSLPPARPFATTSVALLVLADLPPQKDSSAIEHKVTLVCPWSKNEETTIALHFQPPLMTSFRLHTARTRKFAQVVAVGLNAQALRLAEPELTCLDTQVKLTSLNPRGGQPLVVAAGVNVSFLWQLDVGLLDGTSPVKLVFAVKYAPLDQSGGLVDKIDQSHGHMDKIDLMGGLVDKIDQSGDLVDKIDQSGGLVHKIDQSGGLVDKIDQSGGLVDKIDQSGGLVDKIIQSGCLGDKIDQSGGFGDKMDQSQDSIEKQPRQYRCLFEVTNYKTLFVVGSRVEPAKGAGEFCRAGTMCNMVLSVEGVSQSEHNSLMYEVLAEQAMWAVCGRSAGVMTLESLEKQTVTLDVMPLIGGFLPLPLVRLSKYIPAYEQKPAQGGKDGATRKNELSTPTNHPRLEPFGAGQVYNSCKSQQVHVLPSVTPSMMHENSLS